jgi:PAS domain S-box-containing protein
MKAAEVLARVGQALGGEIDEGRIIDAVVGGGRELSGAQIARFVPPDLLGSAGPASEPALDASGRNPSELLVPIRSRTHGLFGALYFAQPEAGSFTARDEALIVALASQAAVAIDNSRLVAALEQQRAEAEDVSRHFRFLAESMPQLVWTADADGQIDYVNERWTVYTGQSADSVRGDVWRQVVHPDDLERTTDAWAKAVSGGTALDVIFRLRRGDGLYRWHLGRAYSLCTETRRVIKWFGTCTDIHDQKRFEDSQRLLSESSRVLASSFDLDATLGTVSALVASWFRGYCIIDLLEDGVLKRVATAHVDPDKLPVVQEMRDYAPGDDRNSPFWKVLLSRQTDVWNNVTEDVLRMGARSPRHEELRRSLGANAMMIAPLVAGGVAVGTIAIGVTGGDVFAADDVRPVDELAHRIALSVSNARAYEQARLANRLKDEFLAIVSHELRTPLNAMRGWLSLLKSARLTEEQQAHAREVIERNIVAQTQLVEDLLDISRIVSGRMRLQVHPVDVQQVVSVAIESIALAAEAKGIRLEKTLAHPGVQVAGDPDRIQQIVWNLLSNAIKFTPRGGKVTVSVRRVDAQVELVVSDTGQGINPEFLPHVFERFRQGDSTTTRPIGGLGLGLAIVRHLAELHGGTVAASSGGEGLGATFTLSLPALMPLATGEPA